MKNQLESALGCLRTVSFAFQLKLNLKSTRICSGQLQISFLQIHKKSVENQFKSALGCLREVNGFVEISIRINAKTNSNLVWAATDGFSLGFDRNLIENQLHFVAKSTKGVKIHMFRLALDFN